MTQTVRLRLASAIIFALVVLITAWLFTTLLGFSSDGLPDAVALALALSAAIWAFSVSNFQAEEPVQYATKVLRYRPLLRAFGLFSVLIVIWGSAHAIVEWSIEPNIYDQGPCSRFNWEFCGQEDLNLERRALATSLLDKIAAGIILIAPLILAADRVRKTFV